MGEQKQVRLNFVTNAITLIISVLIGMVYTPYLVRTLGIAAYGVVPLALVVNNYINVFTGSLTGSLTRFYSVALQKGDFYKASQYLSTSFAVITVVMIGLVPLLGVMIWKLDSIFNIPAELVANAKILFSFTIGSFFLSIFSSVFNITLYATNRLDLLNIIKISRQILKLVFVILFFKSFDTDIAYIGYANMVSEVLILGVSLLLFIKMRPAGISIRMDKFSRIAIMSIMGMTVWVLLHQLGDMGLYRTDNFLVNIFWGTRESGIIGAISELIVYVMLALTVISTLLNPLIIIAYAKGEHEKVQRLSMSGSIVLGVLAASIYGVLTGYSKPFLGYWLGEDFAAYNHWLIIKILPISFSTASAGFIYTFRVWNRVKFAALVTMITGMVNLGITYLILYLSNPSETGIAIALAVSSVFIFIQGYCLNAFCFNSIYRGHGKAIILNMFRIALMLTVSAGFSFLLSTIMPATLFFCIFGMVLCVTGSFAIGYFFVMKPSEREDIKGIFIEKNIINRPSSEISSGENINL